MEELKKVINYKRSGWTWKILLLFFIVILIFGTYVLVAPKQEGNNFVYITKPLSKGELVLTVSATGNIEPVEEVNVGSEVSGTIEHVYVDYNDVVKKGQLLAQIDKTKYESNLKKVQAALRATQASLQNAQAQYDQAKATIDRDQQLRESTNGALPAKSDWDKDWSAYLGAKAGVDSAHAQINQSQQDLISAQYDLQKTTIYSPVDGTVLVRSIDPGQTVAASFQTPTLFTIAKDLTKMELQASIDEADIGKVKEGQDAKFTVDAYPEKEFHTTIKQVRVNSAIVDGVVTYLAVMDFDNKDLLLKPGMSADIDITTNTLKDTFIVQNAALLYIPIKPAEKKLFGSRKAPTLKVDPKPHIWILSNGVPQKVYVKVLGSNGARSAISSSKLQGNEAVIISQEKSK